MNFLDFQQGLFIAFNPILLLLLAVWFAVSAASALMETFKDVGSWFAEKFGGGR